MLHQNLPPCVATPPEKPAKGTLCIFSARPPREIFLRELHTVQPVRSQKWSLDLPSRRPRAEARHAPDSRWGLVLTRIKARYILLHRVGRHQQGPRYVQVCNAGKRCSTCYLGALTACMQHGKRAQRLSTTHNCCSNVFECVL